MCTDSEQDLEIVKNSSTCVTQKHATVLSAFSVSVTAEPAYPARESSWKFGSPDYTLTRGFEGRGGRNPDERDSQLFRKDGGNRVSWILAGTLITLAGR